MVELGKLHFKVGQGRWLDGWMGGWMDGWMDGVGGWFGGCRF